MEPDEISIVLTRASELHAKISDAIERAVKSDFTFGGNVGVPSPSTVLDQGLVLGSSLSSHSRTDISANDLEVEPYHARGLGLFLGGKGGTIYGNIEARSLGLIKEALESLEDQLEQLQLVQQQHKQEKDAVLAELEESRRVLLQRLRDHQGIEWEVVNEVLTFAGEPLDSRPEMWTGLPPPRAIPPPLTRISTLPAADAARLPPPAAGVSVFEPSSALLSTEFRSDAFHHSRVEAPASGVVRLAPSAEPDVASERMGRGGNVGGGSEYTYSSTSQDAMSRDDNTLPLAVAAKALSMASRGLIKDGVDSVRGACRIFGHAFRIVTRAVGFSVKLAMVGATVTGFLVAGDVLLNRGGALVEQDTDGENSLASSIKAAGTIKGGRESGEAGVERGNAIIRKLRGRHRRGEGQTHFPPAQGGGGAADAAAPGGAGKPRMTMVVGARGGGQRQGGVATEPAKATKSPDVMTGRG